jgi:hypothetical protein
VQQRYYCLLPDLIGGFTRVRGEQLFCIHSSLRGVGDAASAGGKALLKCAGRVGRKIIQPDADALCLGKVNVHEFPHAGTEIDGGAAVGNF